ncbi:hypothetical protein LUZ60_011788 [Juncus effusus]|nr:hypothetical protein LUZ60_011788 [Juncus effusus]
MSDSASSTAAPPVSDPAADRAVSFSSHPPSINLDRENFLLWKSQVSPVIHGHNLLGLLTGSDPVLPRTKIFTSNETSSPFSHVPWLRDWSQQSDDLLSLITDRLFFLPHLRKFAICSKNWDLFATERLQAFDADAPLLLLPYNETKKTLSFFNLEKSEIQNLNISELGPPGWICGSTNGWLSIINNNLDLELLNPLTRARVPLPRLDSVTIEDYLKLSSHSTPSFAKSSYLKKVVTMENPTSPLNFLVAIIFSKEQKLGICRLGDKDWTVLSARIKPPPGHWEFYRSFEDIMCHQGKFYALETYSVKVFDYLGPSNVRTATSINIPDDDKEDPLIPFLSAYLVMSSGDLLFVQRYGDDYIKTYFNNFNPQCELPMTKLFKVYRLGKDKETWIRIYSLEGESLFVGSNDSISVSTKERPWLKPDCIYFMDDEHLRHEKLGRGYQCDNGVFSLKENRVVERFNIQHSLSVWPMPALWYQQKF